MTKSNCITVIEIDAAIFELQLLLDVVKNADAILYINERIKYLQIKKEKLL